MRTPSAPPHVIRLADLDDGLLGDVLELSTRIKRRPGRTELAGKSVGMLFFRRSLRTRASFETAVHQLQGHVVNLTGMSDIWELEDREGSIMDGRAPEHVRDAAAVLSRYFDALAIRPAPAGRSWAVDRRDEEIATWARHASVPVINMESTLWHPLQALADVMTMREALGPLAGKDLAIVWVHSPQPASAAVVHSLLHAAVRQGMNVRLAYPPGYELDEGVVEEARHISQKSKAGLELGMTPADAVAGARIVYARSWLSLESYGNATLAASQLARHTGWRIDEQLLSTGNDARLMHAMPVRRNVEATDEVIDGPRSLLYEQAENRLHSQKALLLKLLER